MNTTIDIDTVQGQSVEMENDFIEYLRRTMVAGLRIPPNLLHQFDDVDFARSLSQQNGIFLRMVIGFQKSFSESFSSLFKKLYINEYKNHEKLPVVLDDIEVRFPPPGSLNMTNILDQSQSVQQFAEFVADTMLGRNSEPDPQLRDDFIKRITIDSMPSIDWHKYKEMLEDPYESLQGTFDRQLKKPQEDDPMGMGDMGGY